MMKVTHLHCLRSRCVPRFDGCKQEAERDGLQCGLRCRWCLIWRRDYVAP